MKRDVHEPFPKVERIIKFSEDDIRKNSDFTSVDESKIIDKKWQEFDALVITDGNTIYQYAEEIPVVVYRCSEEAMVMPSSRLNAFIKSITVSKVDFGKCFSLSYKRDMKAEDTGPNTVAYFTDNTGRVIAIQQYDILRFLQNKPDLVISNEGLLIFFTEKEILVTLDCDHYAWVHDVDTENREITSIDVNGEYCIVNLVDMEDFTKPSYKLQFVVDLVDHGIIKPKVTKN